MTANDAAFLERAAFWISYHTREIRDRVAILRSRPEWELRAQAEIQKAKDDLTDMLEMLAEAQRDVDALPTQPLLEAAE
jgi:hypothetical protein